MARANDFDAWAADVARHLSTLGMDMLEARQVPYDNEEWFRREYEGGEDAGMTANEWFNSNCL
ncbi:hypothetical protein GCM10027277_57800 [Pseudoduganella ginsengisoli]|uniref:Uncharacterized protein n=1 Tax=Pseudoduganella ginsengisoli TaxID=1462440 RepID=A0A6L6Q9K1_9BURK|nr:hypothetical protein [Pseudoduganella ginsengisoli]MTW05912.1 hypothetical protein [Pseudoduganella ginsengisoli]